MTVYRILTLNLKTDLPFTRGQRLFSHRIHSIEEMIRWHDPDLIGVQELTEEMLPHMDKLMETYTFYGRGRNRDGIHFADERNCILYKKDRFEFLHGGTFWLSDTPDVQGSRYPTSIYPRIATWAVLKDRETGEVFTFANTHLDHLLTNTKFKQVIVLKKQMMKKKEGSFLAMTGDFNTYLSSSALQALLDRDNPLDLEDTDPENAGSTIRGFVESTTTHYLPIDHIFLSRSCHVINSRVLKSLYMGNYPSDHAPVLTVFDSPGASK